MSVTSSDTIEYGISNRIFFRLFQLGNSLQTQSVKELGITTVQWAVMGALSRPQFAVGMSFGHLARYLVVSRQNLDGVLRRMERERIAQRVTDPLDRRAKKVRLTPKGQALWKRLEKQINSFYKQATASFKQDERIALAHYMNMLQADLGGVSLKAHQKPMRRKKTQKRVQGSRSDGLETTRLRA